MNNRMKIYTALSIILTIWIAFYVSVVMAQSAEMPVTVTIVNCVDYPDDERCIRLNEIEPASGEYHPPEWTPEPETIEHFE